MLDYLDIPVFLRRGFDTNGGEIMGLEDQITIPGTQHEMPAEMLRNIETEELCSFMEQSEDPFIIHLITRLDNSWMPSNTHRHCNDN